MPSNPPPDHLRLLSTAQKRASSSGAAGERGKTGEAVKPGVGLQLAIGRQGLGLELAQPAKVGCLDITELTTALTNVRFPLDVSGGVARFRHRRGQLERIAVEFSARAAEPWIAAQLRGLLSRKTPEVWIALRAGGATVGIVDTADATDPECANSILAFDLAVAFVGEEVRLFVYKGRGLGLAEPPTILALRALEAILGNVAVRNGASFLVPRAITMLARTLMPEAGARTPSTDRVVWSSFAVHRDTCILHGTREGISPAPEEETIRAEEIVEQLAVADNTLFRGDRTAARSAYVALLERAPRHAEISRRIAEVDQSESGRAESAIATLLEAEHAEHVATGWLLGDLYATSSETAAAIASLSDAAERENVPILSARGFEHAAKLSTDPDASLALLDHALARSPRLSRVRWARVRQRLRLGRLEDALADAQYIEAQVSGSHAKYEVWKTAGAIWAEAGERRQAATLFERALRFAPDAPEALAGLGRALLAEKKTTRGMALLSRALELVPEANDVAWGISVALARALADHADDLPSAIARLADVPNTSKHAFEARSLEGAWRGRLGDLPGASLAYARLRDLATRSLDSLEAFARPALAKSLAEAATFEQKSRGDLAMAQRHLAVALRFDPHDESLRTAYRDIGKLLTPKAAATPAPAPVRLVEEGSKTLVHAAQTSAAAPNVASAPSESLDEAEASARVDHLIRVLHADPTQDSVVDELSNLLQSLGRSHELLALLSARLDDASPERRLSLLPQTRAVLARLATEAEAQGHTAEAGLFRDFLSALS